MGEYYTLEDIPKTYRPIQVPASSSSYSTPLPAAFVSFDDDDESIALKRTTIQQVNKVHFN